VGVYWFLYFYFIFLYIALVRIWGLYIFFLLFFQLTLLCGSWYIFVLSKLVYYTLSFDSFTYFKPPFFSPSNCNVCRTWLGYTYIYKYIPFNNHANHLLKIAGCRQLIECTRIQNCLGSPMLMKSKKNPKKNEKAPSYSLVAPFVCRAQSCHILASLLILSLIPFKKKIMSK